MSVDYPQAAIFYVLLIVVFGRLTRHAWLDSHRPTLILFGVMTALSVIGGLSIVRDWLAS